MRKHNCERVSYCLNTEYLIGIEEKLYKVNVIGSDGADKRNASKNIQLMLMLIFD